MAVISDTIYLADNNAHFHNFLSYIIWEKHYIYIYIYIYIYQMIHILTEHCGFVIFDILISHYNV